MKADRIRRAIEEMAELPGMVGCALVEIDAGMVWMSAGKTGNIHDLAEVTSDYWRLYQRLNPHFSDLGELRALVMMHSRDWVSLFPCSRGMLAVTVTRDQKSVDWQSLQAKVRELSALVNDL